MSRKIEVTFESGVGTVTGANFLMQISGENPKKILVDCGLVQGEKWAVEENRKNFSYDPATVDYLFVTHAHLDHVGRIPKLVRDGFKGIIYSTPETKSLARLILDDALGLLTREAQKDGLLPLYEKEDVEKAFTLWQEIEYHVKTPIAGGFDVYLMDAGHILGSTMYNFLIDDKKIVFTGDLGNSPTPLLKDTEKLEGADYLIMESVYGDRNHEPKSERRIKLKDAINETLAKGGTVMIPAFSLERTQVILYELNELVENNEIPQVPVFVDSPLATKVTEIYKNSKNFFNPKTQSDIAQGDDIFDFPKLQFTMNGQDSRGIDHVKGAKIILAGSGMSTGGRMISHEINYLPDPRNTLLLVGYQSVGTLGRKLLDGAKSVMIHGEEVKVAARIENIDGYSSHKDSDHLVEFVHSSSTTLKQVFVVMGEPKASMFLAQKLRDFLDVNAVYPERGKPYELK